MTPRDLIDDLRSRINPAYAAQHGTESYERRLCAEALEAQADEIDRLRTGDTCARQCEGTAYRIEARRLAAKIAKAPAAIMDSRDVLGICAPTDDDFPLLYALQGKRVRLVIDDEPQNAKVSGAALNKELK